MKRGIIGLFMSIFLLLCRMIPVEAQDVHISVPAENIFHRTELVTIRNMLHTNGNEKWRKLLGLGLVLNVESPTIWSTSGNSFILDQNPAISLPTTLLQWQLESINGSMEIKGGTKPGFKSFHSTPQTWYDLSLRLLDLRNDYTNGAVTFTFKIPSSEFSSTNFHAGDYSMELTHNYAAPGFLELLNPVIFTPPSLKVVLSVPPAISWLSHVPVKNIMISSLDDFRTTSTFVLGDLGTAEIGNTVDFDLWAGAASGFIGFTSSKGVAGKRDIGIVHLGSNHSKVVTRPLSSNWQKMFSSGFEVLNGNRNEFPLQLSVSSVDLRKYFFEAGTYSFQLNLDAKSLDNTVSALQNTDVSIQVLPLSEIFIPGNGQTVNFDFRTAEHYHHGQSKVIPHQIRLSNNENFELYVKSDTEFFKKGGMSSDIRSNILQIGVNGGSVEVPLSVIPQKIVLHGAPVLDHDLDMKYTISGESAQSLIDKEKTTYSIDVIYSFTAL